MTDTIELNDTLALMPSQTTTYTGLRLAPMFAGDDAERLIESFRLLFPYGTRDFGISLKTLQECIDQGADVRILDVSVNGEQLLRVRVVP